MPTKTKKPPLFDVVAIRFDNLKVRLLAEGKTLENAEAVVKFAVIRRGMETEFYSEVPAGLYRDGDDWRGK